MAGSGVACRESQILLTSGAVASVAEFLRREFYVSENEEMLTRIRRALGRDETVRPEPLTPFADGRAMRTQANTVGLFCVEFERAQGSIARVASAPELESRLESLLLEEAGATVALSDDVSNLLPGLAARQAVSAEKY
jgi:hypothetical protein